MSFYILRSASGRWMSAFASIFRPSTQTLGMRLLAKCEREERRIRERVAKLQADRRRAYRLIGGRGR